MRPDSAPDTEIDRRPEERRRPKPPEVQNRRRRLLTWTLSLVASVLFVNALVGENGYLATIQARREEAALSNEVGRLRRENEALLEDAHRLQDDPDAVEEVARERNYIRPGETLVIVHDKTPAR